MLRVIETLEKIHQSEVILSDLRVHRTPAAQMFIALYLTISDPGIARSRLLVQSGKHQPHFHPASQQMFVNPNPPQFLP